MSVKSNTVSMPITRGKPSLISEPGANVRTASEARVIAENYLLDYVGDLLGAGGGIQLQGRRWVVPIVLYQAGVGEVGEVGTLGIEAATGEVLFDEDSRRSVTDRARTLSSAASP